MNALGLTREKVVDMLKVSGEERVKLSLIL